MFEATEKGFLPLLDGTIEVNAARPFTFTVRSALKGVSSVLHLQASGADVMETWIDALSHEIEARVAASTVGLTVFCRICDWRSSATAERLALAD